MIVMYGSPNCVLLCFVWVANHQTLRTTDLERFLRRYQSVKNVNNIFASLAIIVINIINIFGNMIHSTVTYVKLAKIKSTTQINEKNELIFMIFKTIFSKGTDSNHEIPIVVTALILD